MKKKTRSFLLIALVALLIICFTACTSSNPCSCGRTPTKRYKNNTTGETEYHCAVCASDCAFCSGIATRHYSSGLGIIIFICDDCYAYIHEQNS